MLVMVPNTTRHLEPEEIERYSMGDSTEEATAKFEEHLLICEICRNRVVESDAQVDAMQAASRRLRQEDAGRRRLRWSSRWLQLLAAAAVIGSVFFWGWSRIAPNRSSR